MKEAKDMKEGWEYKMLGEVAFYPTKRISSEMVNENNYVGVDNLIKDRGGKVVANFFPAEGNVIEYLKGDVLLGNIRPYLKKIWLSDTKGGASGDVLIIRANDTKHLYPNYLYWALASDQFFEYDNLHCKGAKMPRGNKIDIMQYLLPIPTIEEQQQIVSELDLLSEVIEKHKAQLEELDKLAQSIFYDMFGDPVNNEKGWENKKVGEIATFYNGKAHEKVIDDNGDYILVNAKFIASKGEVIKRTNHQLFPLYKNDIVMVMSDVPHGKALASCYLIEKDNQYSLNQRICAFRKYKANPVFLFNVLNRNSYYLRFDDGNGQTNMRKNEVTNCPIPLPPLSLQQEFAAKVEAIEAMKAKVRQSLKEAETLFNSRMDYYFN